MDRQRAASYAAALPPPSPNRRASVVPAPTGPPRRRSSAAARAATHFSEIPMIESDDDVVYEQLQMLPPPPRTLSRRASQAMMKNESPVATPREAAGSFVVHNRTTPHGFGAYVFPVDPVNNNGGHNVKVKPAPTSVNIAAAARRQEPIPAEHLYPYNGVADRTTPNSTFGGVDRSPLHNSLNGSPKQPAPAPQLLAPAQPQGQQINPLRNPHSKVSGVEIHAPLPRLQATTEHAADRTRDAVYQFMEQLVPERAAAVQKVMDQFSGRETLLMEAITSIFGDEWIMHRTRQSHIMAHQAAQDDVKMLLPVAHRHMPHNYHTTDDILSSDIPLAIAASPLQQTQRRSPPQHQQQLQQQPNLAIQYPQQTSPVTAAYYPAQPAMKSLSPPNQEQPQPNHITAQQQLSLARGDSLDLPSTSSRSRPPVASSGHEVQHRDPIGINNSRAGTPVLPPTMPPLSGRSTSDAPWNGPQSSRSAANQPLTSESPAPHQPPVHPYSAAADPVAVVMQVPSNGGILTPPLPQELMYQPKSLTSAPWRK